MPFENPRFAEAGESPGVPRAWSVRSFVRATRSAGFGPAPHEGVERFERWFEFVTRLGVVEQAFFDARPEGHEDFAEGWGVDAYVVDFSDVPSALALLGPEPFETFSAGWSADDFAWSLAQVSVQPAIFLNVAAEDFERGHRNDGYRWRMGGADLANASLGPRGAETFETTWPAHDARGG